MYSSDLRVHIPVTGLYTYPDVTVVCEPPRFEDQAVDTLLNPNLIVEILAPTTEAYDREKKLEHYGAIESLAEYVLVSQESPRVEQYVRHEGGRWPFTATSGLEASVHFGSISCDLVLSQIHHKVFNEA